MNKNLDTLLKQQRKNIDKLIASDNGDVFFGVLYYVPGISEVELFATYTYVAKTLVLSFEEGLIGCNQDEVICSAEQILTQGRTDYHKFTTPGSWRVRKDLAAMLQKTFPHISVAKGSMLLQYNNDLENVMAKQFLDKLEGMPEVRVLKGTMEEVLADLKKALGDEHV